MISSRLKLPDITLVAMTGKRIPEHKKILEKCMEEIEWGKVLLLSSSQREYITWNDGGKDFFQAVKVEPIDSIDEWNRMIIQELPKHIKTSHALLVHEDGYVINPHLWDDKWLRYDYIGAPWPLPVDEHSYRNEEGELQRVGNSVSLRSKKLMDLVATREWKSYFGNTNEDGFICCHNRKWLEEQGCKFAPLEVAVHFSKEHEIPENVGLETFAFHSL